MAARVLFRSTCNKQDSKQAIEMTGEQLETQGIKITLPEEDATILFIKCKFFNALITVFIVRFSRHPHSIKRR